MTPSWQIKMLYDGQCPICSREVAMLARRNAQGQIAFEDISDPSFDSSKYGLTLPQVVGSMHAIRSDGTVLQGVDVFAELYDLVGWTWLSRVIRWRFTRPFALVGYRLFATLRPRFSRFNHSACSTTRCSSEL